MMSLVESGKGIWYFMKYQKYFWYSLSNKYLICQGIKRKIYCEPYELALQNTYTIMIQICFQTRIESPKNINFTLNCRSICFNKIIWWHDERFHDFGWSHKLYISKNKFHIFYRLFVQINASSPFELFASFYRKLSW